MVPRVKKYVLLSSNNEEQLSKQVNAKLEGGWSLYGNPICHAATAYDQAIRAVYQALVKYESE
jgi:hypothetical protein